MSSKEKLSRILELFLNDREKEASELLHEWFVEKARSINQKLMEEEDKVLSDDEVDVEEDDNKETDIEELKKEIEDIKASLEELMSDNEKEDVKDEDEEEEDEEEEDEEEEDEEEEDDSDKLEEDEDEFDVDDVLEDEEEDDDKDEEDEEDEEDDDKDEFDVDDVLEDEDEFDIFEKDDEDEDEKDYDDLDESAMELLKKIKSENTEDEVGIGGNKKFTPNVTSPIPQKKVGERTGATPLNRKDSNYKGGYDMEMPPKSRKVGTDAVNAENTSKKFLHSASRLGDSSALLNKIEGGKGNTTSPVPSNKKK